MGHHPGDLHCLAGDWSAGGRHLTLAEFVICLGIALAILAIVVL
jgi:hypothetical protein